MSAILNPMIELRMPMCGLSLLTRCGLLMQGFLYSPKPPIRSKSMIEILYKYCKIFNYKLNTLK